VSEAKRTTLGSFSVALLARVGADTTSRPVETVPKLQDRLQVTSRTPRSLYGGTLEADLVWPSSLSLDVCRRYAGLFFCICVDSNDNELAYLEAIHLFVEVLGSSSFVMIRRAARC
jgi:hypothetical protein